MEGEEGGKGGGGGEAVIRKILNIHAVSDPSRPCFRVQRRAFIVLSAWHSRTSSRV